MILFKAVNKIKRIYRESYLRKLTRNKEKAIVYGETHIFNVNIHYGKNLKLFPNVCFMGDGEINIGDNVAIGNDTIIYSSKNGGVYIGDNVSIAAHSYIIDSNHMYEQGKLINKQGLDSKKITIGDDVWIADNCTVLKGVNIGTGSVIGAKSLVNKDIDSYGIAYGIPAKVMKYRK